MPFLPFRGCSCSLFIGILVCVVLGVGGYLFGLPRLQDEVQEPIREAVETEVARQIAIAPDEAPAPGRYVIQESELNRGLDEQAGRYFDVEEMTATINPDGLAVDVKVQDQTARYEGGVAAVGGRLRVIDMRVDGNIRFLLPADDMAEILENSVNDYLATRDLRLAAVELGEGTMTLEVEPA